MRTPQFWALWGMLFLNVTAGILFISNAVPIMRELTGAAPATALAVYGFIAVFNGLGRFFWGAVSDRIGRNWAYLLIYGTQVVIFFVVGGVHSLPLVIALFAVVLLDYGGGFGTMPSFTADYFGTKFMGVNYGWILTRLGRRRHRRTDLRRGREGPHRDVLRRPPRHRDHAGRRDDLAHRDAQADGALRPVLPGAAPAGPGRGVAHAATEETRARAPFTGTTMVKTLPFPTSLATSIRQPCARTSLRVMNRPSPSPSACVALARVR